MRLNLLDQLSTTSPKRKKLHEKQYVASTKRFDSLLTELSAYTSDTDILIEHEDVVLPNMDCFFGVDKNSDEHHKMQDHFKRLKKTNPHLCRKILFLD